MQLLIRDCRLAVVSPCAVSWMRWLGTSQTSSHQDTILVPCLNCWWTKSYFLVDQEYAPEPHTISRKEKKVNTDGITLTSMSFKNEPTPTSTHVPVQQSYSNYSNTTEEQQTPPQSAAYQTQNSQNRSVYILGFPGKYGQKQTNVNMDGQNWGTCKISPFLAPHSLFVLKPVT